MIKKTCLFLVGIILSIGVFAQSELSYKNGVLKDGAKISPNQVRTLMEKNTEVLSQYNSGRTLFVAGQVVAFPCAFLVGWDLGARLAGGEGNTALLVGGAVGTVAGLVISLAGEGKMKKSVSLYNAAKANRKEQVIHQINLGLTQTGVGFIMQF